MAYKKFELERLGRKKPERKRYFSQEFVPTNIKSAEGKGLRFLSKGYGDRVIPLLLVAPTPEKFTRKPPIAGVGEYADGLTVLQLRAAHIRFLWQNGWDIERIVAKIGACYLTVLKNVSGKSHVDILPVEPPWWTP